MIKPYVAIPLDLVVRNPALLNEIVRVTQSVVPFLHCVVCNAEGVSFECESCHRLYCPAHAYDTFGRCADCPIEVVPASELLRKRRNKSLDEALNEGSGVYKP